MPLASDAGVLWRGLLLNLLAGLRLAMFLRVRALDFRISAGQAAVLVIACLLLWLGLGVVQQGLPGYVDIGALTASLAWVPILFGACLLAARLFRDAHLAIVFAVVLLACIPTLLVVDYALELVAQAGDIAYPMAFDAVFLAWAVAVLVRAQYVLTGWRGRASAFALVLFVALFAALPIIAPVRDFWVATRDDDADDT